MVEINKELIDTMLQFKIKFGYMPSLYFIPSTLSDDEICKDLTECIENGIDNLMEKYNVDLKSNKLY